MDQRLNIVVLALHHRCMMDHMDIQVVFLYETLMAAMVVQ